MYNPDELELKIDRFRMDRDWNGVLKSIEIYAHVFAVGAAVHSKQHENLEHIRAYYWTVMAELMLEKKHDYLKAFGCVKRSSEIGPHYIDWRIMLIRVLLGRTLAQNRESQVRRHSFFSPNPHIKTPSEKSDNISVCDTLSIVDPADYDPGVMLDGVLHTFSTTERRALLHIVSSSPLNYKNALLAALSILPSTTVLSICTLVLHQSHEVVSSNRGDVPKYSHEELINTWILSTCEHVLRPVSAQDIMSHFLEGNKSEYRLWLCLDALAARSAIHEALGNLSAAKKDELHLLKMVMSTPALDDRSIPVAPLACMNILTASAIRLALLEHATAVDVVEPFRTNVTSPSTTPTPKNKSMDLLLNCIKDTFSLHMFLPHNLRVGIMVETAMLYLEKARIWTAVDCLEHWRKGKYVPSSSSSQTTGSDPVGSDENVTLYLNNAFELLREAQLLMSDAVTGNQESVLLPRMLPNDQGYLHKKTLGHYGAVRNENDLNPISQSLLWLLPEGAHNPLKLEQSASSRLISLLLSSLYSLPKLHCIPEVSMEENWNCGDDVSNEDRCDWVVETLKWGIGCELDPSPHYLHALGIAYLKKALASTDGGNLQHAVAMLEQAHNSIIGGTTETHGSTATTGTSTGEVMLIDASLVSQLCQGNNQDNKVVQLLAWINKYLYSAQLYACTPLVTAAYSLCTAGDYIRAITVLHQGMLDVFGNRDVSCNVGYNVLMHCKSLYLLERRREPTQDPFEIKMFLLNSQCVSDIMKGASNAGNVVDERQQSILSELEGLATTNAGLFTTLSCMLLCVAKAHVLCARHSVYSSTTMLWAVEQDEHRLVAMKIFELLLSVSVTSTDALPAEEYLNYALVLAEMYHTDESIKLVDQALKKTCTRKLERNLLHLKLLLLTSGGQFTAGQDCIQQLKEAGLMDANVELSIFLMQVGTKLPNAITTDSRSNSDHQSVLQQLDVIVQGLSHQLHPRPEDEGIPAVRVREVPVAAWHQRTVVSKLLVIASLYIQLSEFGLAKAVIDHMWSVLFAPPKGVPETLHTSVCGREEEVKRLDALRCVPTLVGWRLSGGIGCGPTVAADLTDLVADALYLCAMLIRMYVLHANSSGGTAGATFDDVNTSVAHQIELLLLAVTLHPRHTQSLVLLGEIELENCSSSTGTSLGGANAVKTSPDEDFVHLIDPCVGNFCLEHANESDVHLSKALKHSMQCLQINKKDFASWFLYGKCMGAADEADRARYAFLTALQCQRKEPWRGYSDVLFSC